VLFIDDLNMPRVDQYGTQQPIALLRQVVERRGMYDRGKELGWKSLKDVQVLGAMGPPGGARNAVDPRFISLFSVFEIQTPSNDNLHAIYQTILGRHLAGMPQAVRVRLGGFQCTVLWLMASDRKLLIDEPFVHPTQPTTLFKTNNITQVREALGDGSGLTDATLELFSHILERLPPTPSRFHYVFNLRDLSRVYEGLLRASSERYVWGWVLRG